MPTIRDVAKLARVSTATVSHVLNESRWVNPDTRRAVLDAIARLNYRPSAIARSLSTKITHTVGVLVADITNPFFAMLVRGIEDRLSAHRYNLIVCNTDEAPEKEARYLDLLLTRRVDGVIVAPTGYTQSLYHELRAQDIPLVFVDRRPPENVGPVVAADNLEASYRATRYLIDLGHRRIAILARNPSLSTVTGRVAGYRKALRAKRIAVDRALMVITDQSLDAAYQGACRLLTRSRRPTAIIATNILMTLGVLRALKELHLNCPTDVSLVCFDDQPWAALFDPPLTVVAQPVNAMCEAAVDTLLRAMQARHAQVQPIPLPDVMLKAELIVRASCKKIETVK